MKYRIQERVLEKIDIHKSDSDVVSSKTPKEIVTYFVSMGLLPKDAMKQALELMTKNNLQRKAENRLGIAHGGRFPNGRNTGQKFHNYNLRTDKRSDEKDDEKNLEENPGNPMGKTSGPGFDYPVRRHFPPDPRGEKDDWPYDDATVTYSNRKSLRKRGLGEPAFAGESKDNNEQDLQNEKMLKTLTYIDQGGHAGTGRHSKSTQHTGDGTYSHGSYTSKGHPGWASSPKGKKFIVPQLQDASQEREKVSKDEKEEIVKKEADSFDIDSYDEFSYEDIVYPMQKEKPGSHVQSFKSGNPANTGTSRKFNTQF